MKTLLLALSLLSGSGFVAHATDPIVKTEPGVADARIVGKIIDEATNQPVDYATVSVKSLDDSTFFTGGLSGEGGKFNVEQLKPGKYEVVISFMGYNSITKTITIEARQKNFDLGEIKIKPTDASLKAVEITAAKPEMMVGIDRKVFDMEKNPITTGGTALDVLRQVPTLVVDIDGNISLRGSSNVTIFMNGKNTGISGTNLTQVLKSMPASTIKSVELITNPSAKYDAAGMNGIINIITKKQIAPGTYGSATLSVGNNNKYNASGSYNTSFGKLITSTNVGLNSNQYWHTAFNKRDNFIEGMAPFSVNNYRDGKVLNDGFNLSGTMDYTFDPKNSLSFNYWGGVMRGFLNEKNTYEFLDENKAALNRYQRVADNNFTSPSLDAGLTYNHNFDTEKKNELILSGNISYNKFPDNQNFKQQQLGLGGEDLGITTLDQHIDMTSITNNYTFQADYTKAVGESGKLEAGVKGNYRELDDNYKVDSLNHTTGIRDRNNLISNAFGYKELISAAYLNYSGSLGKWGYQGGLRAEQTDLQIFQAAVSADPIKRGYANLFPSGFISRKFEGDWETQLSYTKRINRPYSQFLNPFPDFSDPLNVRVGNPYLNAEYVNAYEGSVSKYWTAHSLTGTLFYRDIHAVFQRIREVDASGVSTVRLSNFGRAANMGLEMIARTRFFSWWTNTLNLNVYRTTLNGQTAARSYTTDALNWNVRIMSSFRFMKNADVQLSANYMAPYRLPQGYYYGYSGVDLGFKKDIWDGRASIGFNVQDLLNTRKFKVVSEDFSYKGRTEFKRESRWLSANFTWKFGKPGEGQQPRRSRRAQGGQGSEMNMGM